MDNYLTVPLELKATSNSRKIDGHGAVFGNRDLGGDIVLPGAFAESLAQHKADGTMPAMFWMHQRDKVPGLWDAMSEDDTGLAVSGTLAKTPLGDEIHTLTQMKAVRGLSIGYDPIEVDYNRDGDRLLKTLGLGEVSIVSLAMNPLAMVESVKARLSASGEYVPTRREFERTLRDVGCSTTTAKRIISAVFSDKSGRDDGDLEQEGIASILESCDRLITDEHIADIAAITRD